MYIGMTKNSLNQRWLNGKGYVGCTRLHRAINKYGWENFEHETIASGLTKEEAENFEILLINRFDTTNINFGYNISKGGNTGHGHTGKFMGKRCDWVGKTRPNQHIINQQKCKRVKQYDFKGNLIKEYKSLKEASEENKYSVRMISDVCNDIRDYSHLSIWLFSGEEHKLEIKLNRLLKHKKIKYILNPRKDI